MPSTHTSLHYHIVFSTKDRVATIAGPWRERLHEYLGGTIRGMGATPLQVGGIADHVHIVAGLKATQCVADVVREAKKASTAWIREAMNDRFTWQEGYGAFTISPADVPAVRRYVADQESHHHRVSFHDEYLALLKEHGVEYDPRYIW